MRMAPRTKRSASRLAGSPRSSAMSGAEAAISQPFYISGAPRRGQAIYLRRVLSQIGCGSSGGKLRACLCHRSGSVTSRWRGYPRVGTGFPQPNKYESDCFIARTARVGEFDKVRQFAGWFQVLPFGGLAVTRLVDAFQYSSKGAASLCPTELIVDCGAASSE